MFEKNLNESVEEIQEKREFPIVRSRDEVSGRDGAAIEVENMFISNSDLPDTVYEIDRARNEEGLHKTTTGLSYKKRSDGMYESDTGEILDPVTVRRGLAGADFSANVYERNTIYSVQEVIKSSNKPQRIRSRGEIYFLKEDGTYRNSNKEILSGDIVLGVLERFQAKIKIMEMKNKPNSIKSKGGVYELTNDGQYKNGGNDLDPILVVAYLQAISNGGDVGHIGMAGNQLTYDSFVAVESDGNVGSSGDNSGGGDGGGDGE